jgi:hypothetical protein
MMTIEIANLICPSNQQKQACFVAQQREGGREGKREREQAPRSEVCLVMNELDEDKTCK